MLLTLGRVVMVLKIRVKGHHVLLSQLWLTTARIRISLLLCSVLSLHLPSDVGAGLY